MAPTDGPSTPRPRPPRPAPRPRSATSAQWAASRLVLTTGEQGYDTDTGVTKYGDGVHLWPELPTAMIPTAPTSGGKPVADDWPNLTVLAEAGMA